MTDTASSTQHRGGLLSLTEVAEFSGIKASILMGGDGVPFTVMAMSVASGMGAPAHISFHEDKVFHVFEGSFLFLIGDERLEVQPGDHVFVAKGQSHSFAALGENASMTLISTPAHHDRFFRALSDLEVPHDPERVAAVCKAFDQAIVGPVVDIQCR